MQAPGSPPIPPQLAGPPGPTGPVTAPSPMLGQGASAMSEVRNALVALQKALPMIPMGSDLHKAVLKAVGDIGKHLDPADKEANKGIDIQTLLQQAKAQSQAAPQAALLKAMGGGAAAPPPAGAAPPPQLAA